MLPGSAHLGRSRNTAPVQTEPLTAPPPLAAPQGKHARRRRSFTSDGRLVLPAAVATIVLLAGAWLVVAARTPDLAAQAYRLDLFNRFGMLLWDNNWYAGHHMPGYSLLYQPLAALLGLRIVGALAAVASSVLFAIIVRDQFGEKTTFAAVWFAAAAAGDLWIGRLTFALGVTFALGAVLALLKGRSRGHLALAAGCAVLSTVSSPVAGLLLALAGATHVIAYRRLSPGIWLIAPVLLSVLPLEGLFPEGGFEPYGAESLAASLAVAFAFIWVLPKEEKLLKLGGWVFVLADLLSLLPTPMGSNIVRYAVLLAGPLLAAALARQGGPLKGRQRPLPLLIAAMIGIAFWVAWGPVTQTEEVLKDPSTKASFYVPVERFLASHARFPLRIEVPFTRSHWETALLALHVPLARGWERQLDKRYNEEIEADPLPPAVYRSWLTRNAVSYVALADVPLDGSSIGEAALIRHGAPFLKPVFKSANWRVYKVLGSKPLAEGPGALTGMGHDSFTLDASAKGRFLVRIHYTPYWTVMAGKASVQEAPTGGWTEVRASQPGRIRVETQFSLSGVMGLL